MIFLEERGVYMIIVCQGDSITDCNRFHTDQPLGDGYVYLLQQERKNDTIINRGISGNRIPELFERWQKDTIEEKPDLLFILVGINEIWHKYKHNKPMTTKEYQANYERLIIETKKNLPNVKICLLEPFVFPIGHYEPQWMPDLLEEQKIVYELSFKYHTGFIPLQKIFDEALIHHTMVELLPDGVHPSLEGHKVIKEAIVEYLTLINFETPLK